MLAAEMLREAWECLGGAPEAPRRVRWTGTPGLPSPRLPVAALAEASVAAAALAGAELAAVRSGSPPSGVRVDGAAVATAFASERALRLDGRSFESFAVLSRFWRAADGWVRTHGNYPHHQERLLAALDVRLDPGDPDRLVAAVGDAIAGRPAVEVAERVTAAGGLAVPVRSPRAWQEHDQGAAVARLPWLRLRRAGDAPPLTPGPETGAQGGPELGGGPLLPAAGIRVLDLTRVIAGPVATRTLALLGADVLRIDAPDLPEIPAQHLDTGMGKRSALLDLGRAADRATLDDLVATADVVVTGYRPGALDRFGLNLETLLRRRPTLVVASLSAWGGTGPWTGRRGFDSLVQAACGIAEIEAAPDGVPGALPVQALDHATGYLLAAAVLRGLAGRAVEGGGWSAELSLAQTAAALLRRTAPNAIPGAEGPGAEGPGAGRPGAGRLDAEEWTAERATPQGRLRYALPPVLITGAVRDWERPAGRWGADAPAWRDAGLRLDSG